MRTHSKNKSETSTVVLTYKSNDPAAQKTLDYILSMGYFKISKKLSPIEESEEDIRLGRVYDAKNADDLITQCLR